MSYYPQYFAVITHNTEQHCGFGSALPREELHITPGEKFSRTLGTTFLKFHQDKLRPVSEKSGIRTKGLQKCFGNSKIFNYLPSFDNSSTFVVNYQTVTRLRNFRSDDLSQHKSCKEIINQ